MKIRQNDFLMGLGLLTVCHDVFNFKEKNEVSIKIKLASKKQLLQEILQNTHDVKITNSAERKRLPDEELLKMTSERKPKVKMKCAYFMPMIMTIAKLLKPTSDFSRTRNESRNQMANHDDTHSIYFNVSA